MSTHTENLGVLALGERCFSRCSSSGMGHRAKILTHVSWMTALLTLILVFSLLFYLFSGNLYNTYPIPEVPEGGWAWHYQRGDHQGCRRARWDWPCRDGATPRPDPLVPGPEPYPDTGTQIVAQPHCGRRNLPILGSLGRAAALGGQHLFPPRPTTNGQPQLPSLRTHGAEAVEWAPLRGA